MLLLGKHSDSSLVHLQSNQFAWQGKMQEDRLAVKLKQGEGYLRQFNPALR